MSLVNKITIIKVDLSLKMEVKKIISKMKYFLVYDKFYCTLFHETFLVKHNVECKRISWSKISGKKVKNKCSNDIGKSVNKVFILRQMVKTKRCVDMIKILII